MLILRAIGTLFLGLEVAALDSPSLSRLGIRVQVPRGQRSGSFIGNLEEQGVRSNLNSSHEALRSPQLHHERLSSSTQRKARQDSNQGDDTTSLPRVCQRDNGAALACPEGFGCCVSSDGETACCSDEDEGSTSQSSASQTAAASFDSTVFVTRTVTNTVTSFTGVANTGVVIVTRTEFLTFVDPIQRTQTSTVTVTSFFRRAKRTFGASVQVTPTRATVLPARYNAPRPIITQNSRPGSKITSQPHSLSRKQVDAIDDLILTSTVMATTTIFVDNAAPATITNIVYATTVIAPNAIATVFVTTTVRRPSASSTSSSAPVTTSTGSTPEVSSTADTSLSTTESSTESTSSTTDSTSSSTSSSTTATAPSATLTTTSVSSATMETMDPMLTPTSGPTPTLLPPPPSTSRSLSPGQIIGLVLGLLFGLVLSIFAAIFLRRLVIRRRRIQAEMRQKLVPPQPPSSGPAPAPIVPTGPSSGGSSGGYSGLTGEGEVRIVIRPAPKRRTQSSQTQPQGFVWPMPPGYDGRVSGFPIFIEEGTTTGSTEDRVTEEREWSIVSERGSPSPTMGLRERDERPVTQGSGWDTSVGRRSERSGATGESFPGLGTLLTPPPVHRRRDNWRREESDDEDRILPLGGRSSSDSEGDGVAGRSNRVVRETMGGPSGGGVRGGEGMGSVGIGKAW
ncbi:hypothetical protein QBC44DRAFT_41155 [Cladorrhinum sp. PSN332]|nr:hypothetical protein QBC44DRAFT_41155 [Cladorrhinum sp. PSN332]